MTVDTAASVASPRRDPADRDTDDSSTALRRRFVWATVIGGGFALILFAWMLTRGSFNLFAWQRVGEFYDQQAHALLNGHLSIDASYLGIEAFTVDGSSHIYQGPIPALLRMPIVAVAGHGLDGRLTQVSMLAAFATAIVFAARLHWKARRAMRGDAPITSGEAALIALFTFVLTGGSALLYEASRAWVYHEALLWGAAFALASIDFMIAYVQRPKRSTLAWSAFFAMCTLLTRASVGLGPVVGLGLLFVGALAVRAASRWDRKWWRFFTWLAPGRGDAAKSRATAPWLLAAAAAVPMVAYATVNYAKFNQLFSIPFSAQRFSQIDPGRQEFLRVNGGTMFGLQFLPTTVLQYLRPDAIRFTGHFPFLDFSSFPGPIFGNVTFDLYDRSSSVPTAMPLLTILAIAGLVVLFRPRAWHAPDRLSSHPDMALAQPDGETAAGRASLASLRVPMLAAGAAAFTILPFGYIANRYLADFIPLLALAAPVGLHALMPLITGATARRWAKAAVAGIIVLAVFGAWVNVGLALNYQRLWSYNLDPPVVAGYLGFQNDVGGVDRVVRVNAGQRLPNGIEHPGLIAIVGNCDGLYLSDGLPTNTVKTTPWNAVEQTRRAGHFDLQVAFPERPAGTRVPILTFGDSDAVLLAEYTDDGQVFLEYREPDTNLIVRGIPRGYEPGRTYHLDVRADPNLDLLVVKRDDIVMLDAFYHYDGDNYVLGANDTTADVKAKFPGRFESRSVSAPLCRTLLRDLPRQ